MILVWRRCEGGLRSPGSARVADVFFTVIGSVTRNGTPEMKLRVGASSYLITRSGGDLKALDGGGGD